MANVQPRVIGEDLSDERIKSFLILYPQGDQNPDFYVLMKAYQGLRAHDFKRFIQFFKEAGRDINAKDQRGKTILDVVASHRCSQDYATYLKESGAMSAGD